MDQERLKRVDSVLEEAVRTGEVAGCNALVLKDGKEVYYGQSGWADKETRQPMARNTIFRLFSMSKPITAAAAMILVERGQMGSARPGGKVPARLQKSNLYHQSRTSARAGADGHQGSAGHDQRPGLRRRERLCRKTDAGAVGRGTEGSGEGQGAGHSGLCQPHGADAAGLCARAAAGSTAPLPTSWAR